MGQSFASAVTARAWARAAVSRLCSEVYIKWFLDKLGHDGPKQLFPATDRSERSYVTENALTALVLLKETSNEGLTGDTTTWRAFSSCQ